MQFGLIEGEKIISRRERDFYKEDKEHIENTIEKRVKDYIDEILEENNIKIQSIEAICIASPGTIQDDRIVKADNLGIYNYNIVEMIKKYFDIEIILNNDGKCAAMCEKVYGNLKECDDGIFLNLGTGVGGAVFLGGKLLKPKKYTGFELRTCCYREKWK